jgi:hypothetical protein
MQQSQINIDVLNHNTTLYRSRAERSAFLATVVNKNFISCTTAAQALYEFITGDLMPSTSLSPDALAAARFALNCQDPDIIVDLRKLNGRPKSELFDPFWAKMAEVVEGRVDDRRHGELSLLCIYILLCITRLHRLVYGAGNKLYLPVATSISNLIKKTVEALEAAHSPLTLEQAHIEVPGLVWVSMQFCPKNPLSTRALSYTGKLNLVHKVQQRTLRAYSIDSHYVSAAYKYMRSFGLWLHQLLEDVQSDLKVISASCDDKCKVTPSSLCFYVCASFHRRYVDNLKCLSFAIGQHRRALTSHPACTEGQGQHCAIRL